MQVNPLVNKGNDLLGSLTVPTVAGWASFSVSDMSKYNFISLIVITSDNGSYSVFISKDDLVNINATNALILYGTTNIDRVMIAYTDSTHLGIYNSHTSCTVIVRGFM